MITNFVIGLWKLEWAWQNVFLLKLTLLKLTRLIKLRNITFSYGRTYIQPGSYCGYDSGSCVPNLNIVTFLVPKIELFIWTPFIFYSTSNGCKILKLLLGVTFEFIFSMYFLCAIIKLSTKRIN